MKPQSTKEAVRSRLIARATGLLGVVLLVACLGDERVTTPTGPTIPGPTVQVPGSSASWSIDQATPVEDCMAESINSSLSYYDWPVDLEFERDAGAVSLRFDHGRGFEESEGFWPLEYAGTVDADGAIVASAPASRLGATRTDPWMDLCYWDWQLQEGLLSGILSPDGRRLTGIIMETYRVESNGATFTIHSRFVAEFR